MPRCTALRSSAWTILEHLRTTDPARGSYPGEALPARAPISHLALVERAEAYLIAPASANTLAQGDNAVLKIQLDGSGPGAGGIGLWITASGSTVRGLVVNRFRDAEIEPTSTVFGSVDQAGLATLDKIAKAGVEGGGQDGAPVTKVTIKSVRLD